MSPTVQSMGLFDIEHEDDDILAIRAPWLKEVEIRRQFFILELYLIQRFPEVPHPYNRLRPLSSGEE